MNDAAPGDHPVDVARRDPLHAAQAVAMDDRAVEQIRHGREADVRMRADVHADARLDPDRAEVIEER